MSLLSHAGDGASKAMVLPRQLGRGTMSVPSQADDDTTEAIWQRRGVSAESCWR
jgi:hypothetical protein